MSQKYCDSPDSQRTVTPPAQTCTNLLGEPVPASVTLLAVASATIASATCCGVQVGCRSRISAATPPTWGAAIDVPVFVVVAVSLAFESETMSKPGAKMSTQVP